MLDYEKTFCFFLFFRKPTEVSQNTSTFILLGPPIMNKVSLRNEKLVFLGGSSFKKKTANNLKLQ